MYEDKILDEVSDDSLAGILRISSQQIVVVYFYQQATLAQHELELYELAARLGRGVKIVKMKIGQNPGTNRSYRPQASTIIVLRGDRLEGKLVYDTPTRLENFLMARLPKS